MRSVKGALNMQQYKKKIKNLKDLCNPCPEDYYADDSSYKTYRFKSKRAL